MDTMSKVIDSRAYRGILESYQECLECLNNARDAVELTSEGYDGRIRREVTSVEETVLEAIKDLTENRIDWLKG